MTHPNTKNPPLLSIMGIRGLPARHGGFETFAARLAPYLVRCGWRVTVYCQEGGAGGAVPYTSEWQGVRRVHINVGADTAMSSVRFDWACVRHACAERPPLVLTLGYNTAVFGLALRAAGIRHVMNMDGIEWSRSKWGPMARTWLYLNERAGCLGAHHLLADHPEIERHLRNRVAASKITMIPYGTDVNAADAAVTGGTSDASMLATVPASAVGSLAAGLVPAGYLTLIARPEPENSVLEIVRAFSSRRRGVRLLVLGSYSPDRFAYHREVIAAASDEVLFAGAIYDPAIVGALRRHSLLYLHGHRVGGTNPSLLEAMGAGNAVVAHDNRFNRWVVGDGACYFNDVDSCTAALDRLLLDDAERVRMARANLHRTVTSFGWPDVLGQYRDMLLKQWSFRSPNLAPSVQTRTAPPGSRAQGSSGAEVRQVGEDGVEL